MYVILTAGFYCPFDDTSAEAAYQFNPFSRDVCGQQQTSRLGHSLLVLRIHALFRCTDQQKCGGKSRVIGSIEN